MNHEALASKAADAVGVTPHSDMRLFVEQAVKWALSEAALSAAEPIGYVDKEDLQQVIKCGGPILVLRSGSNEDAPIYAAPPAPSVAVKALEWDIYGTMRPPFISYSDFGFYVCMQGGKYFSGSRNWGDIRRDDGKVKFFDGIEEAKAAAQADYEARIRSALSAQVQDVAGWQPIESAPRDGSEILALWKRSQIQSNWYGVVWFEDGSWREFDYECLVSDPTHWMPLPSPPAAPAKQEA